MSSPAMSLTPGLTLDDPVVHQFLERHHGVSNSVDSVDSVTSVDPVDPDDPDDLRLETRSKGRHPVLVTQPLNLK